MATAYVAVLVMALIACLGACVAEDYTVGDRAGWQAGNVDYQQWAARHTYRDGDSLLFAYDSGSQSVMRVSQEDYHLCQTHRPIEHHVSGNTLVHLKRDDYYFISGVQRHCNAGMKLAVILAGGSPSAAPSVVKAPPPMVKTPPPVAISPTVAPTLPPPVPVPSSMPPVAPATPPSAAPSPTEAPAPMMAPTVEAPASVMAPLTETTPTLSPTEAPVPTTSAPSPSGLAPSPPAPIPFGPVAEPTTAPPPPNAGSTLHTTLSAVIIAAVGILSFLL